VSGWNLSKALSRGCSFVTFRTEVRKVKAYYNTQITNCFQIEVKL